MFIRRPEAVSNSRALTTLLEILQSGRPLVYIRSTEEGRVADLLREAGRQLRPSAPIPVWTWSLTEGLSREDEGRSSRARPPRGPGFHRRACRSAASSISRIFTSHSQNSAAVRRRLRDLYHLCLDHQKFIVITSPLRSIPEEVERSFVVVDLPPPDLAELIEFLRVGGAGDLDARGARGHQRGHPAPARARLAGTQPR